jgi:hypothetical protein
VKHAIGVLPILISLKSLVIDVLSVVTHHSTFPILPNEEFTFNYNEKRGVELEFGLKKSKDRIKGK